MMGPIDLADRHLALLDRLLAEHVPNAEVWAFGSRVSGTGHECSDIDLALQIPGAPGVPVDGPGGLRESRVVRPFYWAVLPVR
jgi:predicted nucleotidyltransferase